MFSNRFLSQLYACLEKFVHDHIVVHAVWEMTNKAKQEEKQMAEKVIRSISMAIVEAVSPAVVEQEDSYNKLGTMVSCCDLKF